LHLTREQLDAIFRAGQDVCVAAGPGAGKTALVAERFLWRVEQGTPPLRILAFTLTERAAAELRARLTRGLAGVPGAREQIGRAYIATVSGFCERLLREHAIEAGLDPGFCVLNPAEARASLLAASEEAFEELLRARPEETAALLEAVDLPDPAACLSAVYEALRITAPDLRRGLASPGQDFQEAFESLAEPLRRVLSARPPDWSNGQQRALEMVKDWCREVLSLPKGAATRRHFEVFDVFECNLDTLKRNNAAYDEVRRVKQTLLPAARQALAMSYYAPQHALLWDAIERVARNYGQRKHARRAVDGPDLEERAAALLRDNAGVRERIRQGFDEVLIDELQDTNPLQQIVLDLVTRSGRFFATGDANAAIWGRRHAGPETFRRYRDRLEQSGQTVDRLAGNHRSRADILAASGTVLRGAPGIEPAAAEPMRRFADKAAPSVELIAAIGASPNEAAALEARWVARRVLELAGDLPIQAGSGTTRPARFADIAVLVRNARPLPELEQAFREFGVPFVTGGGTPLLLAPEVSALVALLRVLANPRDETASADVLRSPLAGLGQGTLLRLQGEGSLGAVLGRLEEDPKAYGADEFEKLHQFRCRLSEARAVRDEVAPDVLVGRFIDAAGYTDGLDARQRANISKFLGVVREWFAAQPRTLPELTDHLELLGSAARGEPETPPEDGSDAVRVMTIHAAKGLEFPIVFLAALDSSEAAAAPPLAFSPSAGLVARWRDPVTGQPLEDPQYTAFVEETRRREQEEENRLLYVAMTRAEEHLVFSFAAPVGCVRGWAERVAGTLEIPLGAVGQAYVRRCPAAHEPLRVRVLCVSEPPGRAPAQPPGPADADEVRPVFAGFSAHDSTAAVNSLLLYQSCPRLYYLGGYLGWEPPVSEARRRPAGTPDAGALGRHVRALLSEAPLNSPDPVAAELVARFGASELGRRIPAAERAETGFTYHMAASETVLRGRIDLWFVEAGEVVLVDFETENIDAAEAEAQAELYALRSRLNALALERATGKLPDRAFVCFLRPGVAVPVLLSPADLDAALETVRAFERAQSDLEFPALPGPQCRDCPYYRGLCPEA
jgi:ATP-dependent exoDNAse (exonuclease V) beta subunit